MGGRGASFGGGGIRLSEKIKKDMLNIGLNSKFAGVRRDAESGTGAYAYKNATAVNYNMIQRLNAMHFHERNGNTLVDGVLDGKAVFYANKSDSSEIKNLKNIRDWRTHIFQRRNLSFQQNLNKL